MPTFDHSEVSRLAPLGARDPGAPPPDRQIYQTSTMGALLNGVYEGDVTIRELLRHGDFGLGTFNGLDGEMLVIDGVCYQLRADGSATIADLDELTPFAAVTWFNPDRTIEVSAPRHRAALKLSIDEALREHQPDGGRSRYRRIQQIRTRTVTEQHRPYRPFTEATQDQQEVTFTDVEGTLAGFRMPDSTNRPSRWPATTPTSSTASTDTVGIPWTTGWSAEPSKLVFARNYISACSERRSFSTLN